MKRILLPTDFSDISLNAITYALRLFQDEECTFYLLHTYSLPIYEAAYLIDKPIPEDWGAMTRETSLTKLEQVAAQLKKDFKNPKHAFQIHTAFNTLLNEVQEVINAQNIHYVVIGTKGATGAREIIFGTNAVHLIRRVRRPIISVPPTFPYEAPKEILFPTDFEINYPREKFEMLLRIAELHNSRINVLHVSQGRELSPAQEKNKTSLEKLLGAKGLFHTAPQDEIVHAVNAFQNKEKMNLLVMAQNKHTFFERLFIEPVIRKTGLHLTIPLLVIPHL